MPPAVEAQLINHWTTREVLAISFVKKASVGEDMEKRPPEHCRWECKIVQLPWKGLVVPQKIKYMINI